ncbi:hypothetical protein SAMN06265379_1034 [Saccharicrinis carchari]|uniref:Uncharacterized protein n=1 Tax=Saccharicrinis carchari TaxID=1168039 RepID=A0A521CEG6_SACCC|nr:hypothetical protein SAMN06265379_1034 [Saccharicrinis carchari]
MNISDGTFLAVERLERVTDQCYFDRFGTILFLYGHVYV